MSAHPTLVLQRARVADALAAGDAADLRLALVDGAMFASLTIQAPTERAETTFERWIALGRPADVAETGDRYLLQSRNRRLAAVRALTDGQVCELATVGSPAAETRFRALVPGFGWAKASFALACAGFGHLGCIDGRLQRKHAATLLRVAGGRSWPAALRSKDALAIYLNACAALWPGDDSASGQWQEWLADLSDRYSTDHALLLGPRRPAAGNSED